MSRVFSVTLVAATLVSLGILWSAEFTLGVPEEWVWDRIDYSHNQSFDALGWLLAIIVGGLCVLFFWLGARRLVSCSKFESACWLSGCLMGTFCWQWAVLETMPVPFGASRIPFVLYYPRSSGYYFEARYEIDSIHEFLSNYESKMNEGDVLHVGTHPPGLFLFHYGILQFCQSNPKVSEFLISTQPQSVQIGFAQLADNTMGTAASLLPADHAAIWLAALLTQFMGIATVIPLYHLARLKYSRTTSWQAVAFWTFVPAVIVFLPKSDLLYPFIGATVLYLWIKGLTSNLLRYALLAGLAIFIGMCLSLAMLPTIALVGLFTIWNAFCDVSQGGKTAVRSATTRYILTAAAAFILAVVVVSTVFDINLIRVWVSNLQNHARFYEEYDRTFWKWLVINPLEFAIASGVPLTLIALFAVQGSIQDRKRRFHPPHIWCCLAIGTLLWISGKNMGEAARLWINFIPWLVWMSAPFFLIDENSAQNHDRIARPATWILALVFQLAACLGTATCIDGFHLAMNVPADNVARAHATPASASQTGGQFTDDR